MDPKHREGLKLVAEYVGGAWIAGIALVAKFGLSLLGAFLMPFLVMIFGGILYAIVESGIVPRFVAWAQSRAKPAGKRESQSTR